MNKIDRNTPRAFATASASLTYWPGQGLRYNGLRRRSDERDVRVVDNIKKWRRQLHQHQRDQAGLKKVKHAEGL